MCRRALPVGVAESSAENPRRIRGDSRATKGTRVAGGSDLTAGVRAGERGSGAALRQSGGTEVGVWRGPGWSTEARKQIPSHLALPHGPCPNWPALRRGGVVSAFNRRLLSRKVLGPG